MRRGQDRDTLQKQQNKELRTGRFVAVILAAALAVSSPLAAMTSYAGEETGSVQAEEGISSAGGQQTVPETSVETQETELPEGEKQVQTEETDVGVISGSEHNAAQNADDPVSAQNTDTDGNPGEGNSAVEKDEAGAPEAGQQGINTDDPAADAPEIRNDDVGGQSEAGEESVPVEEKKPDPEEEKKNEPDEPDENPWAGLKSIEELKLVPDTGAESTIEYYGKDAAPVSSRGWTAGIYYVNQPDTQHFEAGDTFSLKYQMEFRSSLTLAPGAVEIRVPLSLIRYTEEGEVTEVPPALVGLPLGYPGVPAEAGSTFFNFYIDENSKELVFHNYMEIPANTGSAWQVLYTDIDISRAEPDAAWSVTPKVTVSHDGIADTLNENEILPITGRVAAAVDTENTDDTEDTGTGLITENTEESEDQNTPSEDNADPGLAPMKIADLKKAPADIADAALETPDKSETKDGSVEKDGKKDGEEKEKEEESEKPVLTPVPYAAADRDWTFDTYYMGQSNPHNVSKTDDFSLKYQMEFNTSVDIENPGDVQIRIPASLVKYGHPNNQEAITEVLPDDYGIPMGGYDPVSETYTYTPSSKSQFNYYIEDTEAGKVFVFFNYTKIYAGSKNAWQILYRNYDAMQIEDRFEWHITPDITVLVTKKTGEGEEEQTFQELQTVTGIEKDALTLHGSVDTHVELQKVTKKLCYNGSSYTPGLYTKKQLLRFAPDAAEVKIPEGYAGASDTVLNHFDDYRFVVWEITAHGYANQPYDLNLAERTFSYTYRDGYYDAEHSGEGFIVGVYPRGNSVGLQDVSDPDSYSSSSYISFSPNGLKNAVTYSKNRTMDVQYYVVTAYPKDYVLVNQSEIYNNVTFQMIPFDRKDYTPTSSAQANWTFRDYKWNYRGDIIGITKDGSPDEHPSWITVYNVTDNKDLKTSDFNVRGTCRSFKLTHIIDSSDETLGTYIPGRYVQVTTADDVVYAYPQTGSQARNSYILDYKDYYFNKATVSITDQGYDTWEDEYAVPVTAEQTTGDMYPGGKLDRDLHVYAMFALDAAGNPLSDAAARTWEEIGTVPWSESGKMSYTFTDAQIAREPWRVKMVHNAVDYVTYSDIATNITIKGDSPQFAEFPDASSVRVENIAGIMGQAFQDGEPFVFAGSDEDGFFQDQRTEGSGNYGEPGLVQLTLDLYHKILMRDSKMIDLLDERTRAHARKSGNAKNDSANGRAVVRYQMEGYEGYRLYAEEAVEYLNEIEDFDKPDRKEVVFYDLLPFGVQFDPSGKVVAGRMQNTHDKDVSYQPDENTWDKKQVSVVIDPKTDIIRDYRGTGRTLVKLHVLYSGRDSSLYNNGMWFTGFGVAFDAYVNYEDYAAATEEPNIVAYMPGNSDSMPILGTDAEVSYDDGNVVGSDGFSDYYKDLGADINGDGVTTTHNVLYAQSQVFSDIALAAPAGIEKFVRADTDQFGIYKKAAAVLTGGGYEYKITVTNSSTHKLRDLVVFDRLENAIIDRDGKDFAGRDKDNNPISFFDDKDWKGSFESVNISELKARGAAPVVYYNADRNAAVPPVNIDQTNYDLEWIKKTLLTPQNGWIRAEEWTGEPADVKAVAVDISANDFKLQEEDSVSFYVHMKAPDTMPENGAVWAYNNPGFYSYQEEVNTKSTVNGGSVKTKLVDELQQSLEVEKQLAEDTPEVRKGDTFKFYLTWKEGYVDRYGRRPDSQISNKQYRLYEKNAVDKWVEIEGLHATDASGVLYLKNRQKAVFEDLDANEIEIREEDSLRWTPEYEENTGNYVRNVTCINHYRPILYINKSVLGYSTSDIEEINQKEFRMCLKDADGQPVKNEPLYVVRTARLDGGEPVIINAVHKLYGNLSVPEEMPSGTRLLRTDDNGEFSIYANETVAMRAEKIGSSYTVSELNDHTYGEEDDWICVEPEVSGEVGVKGEKLTITNHYRWKELRITKTVEDAEPEEVKDREFTFRIYEAKEEGTQKGEQITGFKWQLLDSDSAVPDENKWTVSEDGVIKAACAGKVICVSRFRVDTELIVEEELTDDLKEDFAVVKGEEYVVIPKFASAGHADLVNEWLKRDLEISKTVVTGEPDPEIGFHLFTMYLEKSETAGAGAEGEETQEPEERFVPVANAEYVWYDAEGSRLYYYQEGEAPVTEPDETKTEIVLKTDEKGKVLVPAGMTARFENVGNEGLEWRVREAVDKEYPPIAPRIDDGPYAEFEETTPEEGETVREYLYSEYIEGVLADHNRAEFVNGNGGVLILQKKWTADDETAQEYLEENASQICGNGNVRIEYDKARFDEFHISVIAQSSDAWSGYYWDQEEQRTIYYWSLNSKDAYVVFKLPEGSAYDPKEIEYVFKEIDPQQYYSGYGKYADTYFVVNPEKSEYEITGNAGEQPIVTFENHIASSQCLVQKRFEGSAVPAGSVLTWRVEKYENGIWQPAEGVNYTIGSRTTGYVNYPYSMNLESHPVPAAKGVTGSDGLIQIVPGEKFYSGNQYSVWDEELYAWVYNRGSVAYVFFDRKVNVNEYVRAEEGDYRVVEVPEKTDENWGVLKGYTISPYFSDYYSGSPVAGPEVANGFINTVRHSYIKVQKIVDEPTDQVFSFTIEKYISALTDEGAVPGAGLAYAVVDSETNEILKNDEKTTAKGKFYLQGGQYAVIEVPPMTRWKITEEESLPYYIDSIDVSGNAAKLEGNSVEMSLMGKTEDLRSLDMIRSDFTNGLFSLEYELYGTTDNGSIRRVIFGKASDYPDVAAGKYVVMDANLQGSIRGYLQPSSSGGYDFYVLSDSDVMYSNYNSSNMFANLYNMNEIVPGNLDTSKAVTMNGMFYNCDNMTDDSLKNAVSGWNTENVTDMSYMFNDCDSLASLDSLAGLNTDNVTRMQGMFQSCDRLSDLNGIKGWNMGNVADISYMFAGCYNLNSLEGISSWDVSNVKYMYGTFQSCSGLTGLDELSSWNTGSVEDLGSTFAYCGNLKSLDGISGWDVSKVKNMYGTFNSCSGLTSLDELSGWNTGSVENLNYTFAYCGNLKSLDGISGWDVSQARYMYSTFYSCSGLTDLEGLSSWNTGSAEDLGSTFAYCSNLKSLEGISSWDVGKVKNMNSTFYSCSGLSDLNDLSEWDTSNVETMDNMFSNCTNLTDISAVNLWDKSKVRTMGYMFNNCPGLVNLEIKDWNMPAVTNLNYLFSNCPNLLTIDMSGWKTPVLNYSSFNNIFGYNSSIKTILASDWDMGGMTQLQYFVSNLPNLETLDASNWNTQNVTSLYEIFYNARKLTDLNVSGWDVSKVTSFANMFYNCEQLESVNMAGWNPGSEVNFYGMFSGCRAIESVDMTGISMTGATSFSYMFNNCIKLKTVAGINSWDTQNVKNMSYMFNGCDALEELDISNWNTNNTTDFQYMFYSCDNLKTLNLGSMAVPKGRLFYNMFNYCTNLRTIYCSEDWSANNSVYNDSYMFSSSGLPNNSWTTGMIRYAKPGSNFTMPS